jgi:hypothetical protein
MKAYTCPVTKDDGFVVASNIESARIILSCEVCHEEDGWATGGCISPKEGRLLARCPTCGAAMLGATE